MSGSVVDRLEHSCGSKRGLNVFANDDGTYSGFCFSCSTYVPNPYEDKPVGYKPPVGFKKTPEEVAAEIKAISHFKSVYLPDRKIEAKTLEHYGTRVSLSEEDGETVTAHYYPYFKGETHVGYKCRLTETKKFWGIGKIADADLFGWKQAIQSGTKRIYITEGEIDAMALFQIIKSQQKGEYALIDPAVVSLVNGSSSAARTIAACTKDLRTYFKEIVLVFDMDKPGQDAVEDVMKILPEAIVAALPAKDAGECLKEGRSKACFNAVVFNAKKPKNTRIVTVGSVVEKARQKVDWGFSWPYKKLTEITRGIRLGETYYIGAGVKMGKSELLNDIVAHCIREHGWKVFVAKPEEANHRTVQGIAGKLAHRIFHDPKIEFDYEAFDKVIPELEDKLFMLNLYQELSWEGLKEDIRYAVSEGAKAVFIDPITVLSNGINAADANTLLQKMAQELSALAMDMNFVAMMFAHLKAPDAGLPHERGGSVQSYQFAGSRAMMRSAHLLIGLEGNKDPDLPDEQRNLRSLVVLENRMSGETGRIPLYYDRHTGAFNQIL